MTIIVHQNWTPPLANCPYLKFQSVWNMPLKNVFEIFKNNKRREIYKTFQMSVTILDYQRFQKRKSLPGFASEANCQLIMITALYFWKIKCRLRQDIKAELFLRKKYARLIFWKDDVLMRNMNASSVVMLLVIRK